MYAVHPGRTQFSPSFLFSSFDFSAYIIFNNSINKQVSSELKGTVLSARTLNSVILLNIGHIKRLTAYSAFVEYIGRRFFFARSNRGTSVEILNFSPAFSEVHCRKTRV